MQAARGVNSSGIEGDIRCKTFVSLASSWYRRRIAFPEDEEKDVMSSFPILESSDDALRGELIDFLLKSGMIVHAPIAVVVSNRSTTLRIK